MVGESVRARARTRPRCAPVPARAARGPPVRSLLVRPARRGGELFPQRHRAPKPRLVPRVNRVTGTECPPGSRFRAFGALRGWPPGTPGTLRGLDAPRGGRPPPRQRRAAVRLPVGTDHPRRDRALPFRSLSTSRAARGCLPGVALRAPPRAAQPCGPAAPHNLLLGFICGCGGLGWTPPLARCRGAISARVRRPP